MPLGTPPIQLATLSQSPPPTFTQVPLVYAAPSPAAVSKTNNITPTTAPRFSARGYSSLVSIGLQKQGPESTGAGRAVRPSEGWHSGAALTWHPSQPLSIEAGCITPPIFWPPRRNFQVAGYAHRCGRPDKDPRNEP